MGWERSSGRCMIFAGKGRYALPCVVPRYDLYGDGPHFTDVFGKSIAILALSMGSDRRRAARLLPVAPDHR